jgi:hypothetical protein
MVQKVSNMLHNLVVRSTVDAIQIDMDHSDTETETESDLVTVTGSETEESDWQQEYTRHRDREYQRHVDLTTHSTATNATNSSNPNKYSWKKKPYLIIPNQIITDNCSICLEYYKPNENYCKLMCGHNFHEMCVDSWLKVKSCCPVCRERM